MRDGSLRKTISVLALGRCYQIKPYENPWKVPDYTLKTPSGDSIFQSMMLRDVLTSQLRWESQATMDYRYPRAILKVSRITPNDPGHYYSLQYLGLSASSGR